MREHVSDWIVGIMMSVFGVVGLILASGANDSEMAIFGFGLAIFAVVFVIGIVRRHYDEQDRATAKARVVPHG